MVQRVEEVDNFLDSLKSPRTKEAYATHRERFLHFIGRDSINEDNAAEATSEIIRYLKRLKDDEGLSYSYRNIALSAIKHDYIMRDKLVLNWKKIAKFLGENERKYEIRGYTHDEIRRLLDVADINYRAIILVLASTGMRRDALVKMESKDLEYLQDAQLYKIKIYKKSKFEQICFTTPEAAEAIKLYVSKRPGAKYFLNVGGKAVSKMLGRLAAKAGISTKKGLDGSHRNEIPSVHGLRKFAATQMGRSDMKVEAREIILGHSIGVRAAYQKYSDEDLLQEYLKAVDLLTINEANRLRKKVDALEEKEDRIRSQSARISVQEDEIRLLKEELERLGETTKNLIKQVNRLNAEDQLNDKLVTALKEEGLMGSNPEREAERKKYRQEIAEHFLNRPFAVIDDEAGDPKEFVSPNAIFSVDDDKKKRGKGKDKGD